MNRGNQNQLKEALLEKIKSLCDRRKIRLCGIGLKIIITDYEASSSSTERRVTLRISDGLFYSDNHFYLRPVGDTYHLCSVPLNDQNIFSSMLEANFKFDNDQDLESVASAMLDEAIRVLREKPQLRAASTKRERHIPLP